MEIRIQNIDIYGIEYLWHLFVLLIFHLFLKNEINEMTANCNIPDDVLRKYNEASSFLIPTKSSERYGKEYKQFNDWKRENGVSEISEEIMLAYLFDLSKKMSSSSLWSKYSMVKAMLQFHEKVDVSKFYKVQAFLKKQSVNYQPKQAKTLTREDVVKFVKEAPDRQYLLAKIISLIGIAGGCRREEIYEMSLDDIEETSTQLVITIPFSKTNKRRVFTVIDEMDGISVLELFRRYVALRPKGLGHNKLFVGYRNGKCISQRVGIHTVGGVPKRMAQFLGLANPESYTGHCFRRTSATLLANAGVELSVLKRHGGWKSSSVAEKYIEDSLEGKRKVAKMIQGGENFVQVLTEKSKEIVSTSVSSSSTVRDGIPRLEITGNRDCTINVTVNV